MNRDTNDSDTMLIARDETADAKAKSRDEDSSSPRRPSESWHAYVLRRVNEALAATSSSEPFANL